MTLTWQGLDLQPAHRRWRFWIVQGRDELPEVRSTSDLIPFRSGRLHQPGIADRRMIEIRGYIQEASLAAFRTQHDTLKGLLDPMVAVPGILVDDFEDGTTRWIRAVPRSLIPAHGGEATRLLSIELEAVSDPLWHATLGTLSLDGTWTLDGTYTLPSSAPLILTPDRSPFDTVIDTFGTASIEDAVVTITGPSASAPGVSIVETGVGFTIGAALTGGSSLVLDNRSRTVLLDGVSDRASLVLGTANANGEYLRLPAGRCTLRVVGSPASVRVLFTTAYQ